MPFFALITGTFFLDQLSKFYVQGAMELGATVSVLPEIFHITYILNRGAAFGILEDQRVFFICIAVVMMVCVWRFYGRIVSYGVFMRSGTGLLVGGAAGNLVDRVRLGAVVDFFDFRIWPIFNVADIAIVCGVALMIYALLFLAEKGGECHESG